MKFKKIQDLFGYSVPKRNENRYLLMNIVKNAELFDNKVNLWLILNILTVFDANLK